MQKSLCSSILLMALLGAAVSSLTAGTDWPQWRGPTRDGKVAAQPAWPASLADTHLRRIWRVDLGPGYSGPLVVANRVFTTETKDEKTEVVRALDRATGKELWSTEWGGALSVPFFAKSNGDWIRATPVCDGKLLFVAGMMDVLVCLDAATGKEVWRQDCAAATKSGVSVFGNVSSPLLDGDSLFTQAGGAVIKLDARTGKIQWRSLEDGGGMNGGAFSSPLIGTLAGQRQLIVQTREKLAGLDLSTGRPLWESKIDSFRGMNILTPVVYGGGVFTSTYGGRSLWLKVSGSHGQLTAEEGWSQNEQGYMSTPVVVGDFAYHHLKSQHLVCYDLRDGAEKWKSDAKFGKYWSLVSQGDRVLGLDERGMLFLLHANPLKCEILDQRKISDEDTWAHLGVSGNELFVRELKAMAVWRWE